MLSETRCVPDFSVPCFRLTPSALLLLRLALHRLAPSLSVSCDRGSLCRRCEFAQDGPSRSHARPTRDRLQRAGHGAQRNDDTYRRYEQPCYDTHVTSSTDYAHIADYANRQSDDAHAAAATDDARSADDAYFSGRGRDADAHDEHSGCCVAARIELGLSSRGRDDARTDGDRDRR